MPVDINRDKANAVQTMLCCHQYLLGKGFSIISGYAIRSFLLLVLAFIYSQSISDFVKFHYFWSEFLYDEITPIIHGDGVRIN